MVDKIHIIQYFIQLYILYVLFFEINKIKKMYKINNKINKKINKKFKKKIIKKIKKNKQKIHLLKKKYKYLTNFNCMFLYENYNVTYLHNLCLLCKNKHITIFLPNKSYINIGKIIIIKNMTDGNIFIESKTNIINNINDSQIRNKIILREYNFAIIMLLNLHTYMIISSR